MDKSRGDGGSTLPSASGAMAEYSRRLAKGEWAANNSLVPTLGTARHVS